MEPLLQIVDLSVEFAAAGGPARVVRGVSLEVGRGEIVGLVGESGSGKSLTALSVMGLLPTGARRTGGEIWLDGATDLATLPESELRKVRGRRVAMIFQEPATALNPMLKLGTQIVEVLRLRRASTRRAARAEAARLLERVAMPDPGRRLDSYPHQLSGGQRQRAMIAIALASGPDLLLADEPTTALDVTVQAQVVELLESLRRELGLAVLLITHDLGLVAEICDRVAVMYAGELVEIAGVEQLFAAPRHPYTRALLATLPNLGAPHSLVGIPGQVPDPARLPAGCSFAPRCGEVFAPCHERAPALVPLAPAHHARCWLQVETETPAGVEAAGGRG